MSPRHFRFVIGPKVPELVEGLGSFFYNRFYFSILSTMKQKIPGILFLLAMPLSVLLYIKVEALSGSEILGLLSAVGLYVLVGLLIALLFNKKE